MSMDEKYENFESLWGERHLMAFTVVLDGEICKSCHTAGFQTSDHRLGIFKVAHHVAGGFADLWAHMVRSCSQELGLVGEPVDLRLAAFVFFTHQNCGWPLPSDFDQIRCSGISPKEALLSWHQRNVGARILSEQCSPQLHVGVGLNDGHFGSCPTSQFLLEAVGQVHRSERSAKKFSRKFRRLAKHPLCRRKSRCRRAVVHLRDDVAQSLNDGLGAINAIVSEEDFQGLAKYSMSTLN